MGRRTAWPSTSYAPAYHRQIKVSRDDFGLMSYDPAFLNTASCPRPG